jgi:RimJ/RimL family protein N-acetyltransferase
MTPQFVTLKGKPACLILPEVEHLDLFLKLQNEIEARQYFDRFWPIGRAQELDWIAKANSTQEKAVFAVATQPELKVVGSIGLHEINWKDRHASLGIGLLEEHCNGGVGTCAAMLLLSWAFLELGLNKVEWCAMAHNARSIACGKKCGAEEVGRLKRHYFRRGTWHDQVVMEVHADTWRRLWKRFKKGALRKT